MAGAGGGRPRKLASYKGMNTGASWSPDGSKLAVTLSKDGNPEIYVTKDDSVCGNDIALIVLDQQVPANEAKPIIPGVQYSMTDKRYSYRYTAIGYGSTSPAGGGSGTGSGSGGSGTGSGSGGSGN